MNLSLSNAFRTLHDLGVIELITVNDRKDEWVMTEESEEHTYFDVEYYFRKYEKK